MKFIGDCVGVLIQIILDQAKVGGAEFAKEQVSRLRLNDGLPKNAHIRFAIADSHVRALRRLVEQFETELKRQDIGQNSPLDRANTEQGEEFCRAARKVISSNRNIFLDPVDIEATFGGDQIHDVFNTLMGTSFLDERQEISDIWIRDAAWERLLASIKYDEAMAPARFRAMFESKHTGYLANFAYCFRDRLKDPKNTELFHITTALSLAQIRELLSARWDNVEEALALQRATIDTLVSQLRLTGRQVRILSRPRLDRHEGSSHPSAGFRYERALDDIVGREAEMHSIETDFLAAADPLDKRQMFRWQALCGDAGSGKSRLAMELLDRVEDFWPISGFLDAAATSDLSWIDALSRPSFIVVDYAGARAGVAEFLSHLASQARSGKLPAPIRVLLLERRKDDPLFTRLRDIEALRDVGPSTKDDILELRQIDDVSILQLMRGRLGEQSQRYTDAELLGHLADFDKRKRPLFAAIVAAFLKSESLPIVDRDASAEQARWRLFEALIRTWRSRVWSGGITQESLGAYEELASLATFIKGLSVKDHHDLAKSGNADGLPPPHERTYEQLRRILGPLVHIEKGNYLYPAMEPDLAGECLVLGLWIEPDSDGAILRPLADERAAVMAQIAWQLAPWKAADFARRCYQSYPTSAAAVRYLLPDEVNAEALQPKAMAIASIIAEYVIRHRARADAQRDHRLDVPSIAEQQEILALYELFDDQIVDASEADIEIARTLAASTRQVTNFLAHAINGKASWVENSFGRKLEDIADGRVEKRPSANRKEFNVGATGDKRVLH